MYFKDSTFDTRDLTGNDILLNHCVLDSTNIIVPTGDSKIIICDSSLHNVKIISDNEGICNIILRNNLIQDSVIMIHKHNMSLENTFVTLIANTIRNLTCEPLIHKDLIHAFDNSGLNFDSHTESWYDYVNHPLIKPLKYSELKGDTQLDVKNIMQNPELPTGCEITSLTIVLNYLGYIVSKEEMVNYLDKAPIGEANPWIKFIGSPFDPESYGCYTTCLEKAAVAFKENNKAHYQVESHVGLIPEELYSEIDKGYPVIVWANMSMMTPRESTLWSFDGHPFRWRANEHCLVLIGYDKENVYMADPLKGNVAYNKSLFELRYQEMYAQSLILEEGQL